jgi:hypothetical protein
MKSKIRVDVDFGNNPIIKVNVEGHPYYDDQDLRDKFLAQLFDGTALFTVEHTGGYGSSDGACGSTYELRPVKRDALHVPILPPELTDLSLEPPLTPISVDLQTTSEFMYQLRREERFKAEGANELKESPCCRKFV